MSAFDGNPVYDLHAAGFDSYVNKLGVEADDLFQPLATIDPDNPRTARIWPRFCGYERARSLVPSGATWTSGAGHWVVGSAMLPHPGIELAPGVEELIEKVKREDEGLRSATAELAASKTTEEAARAGEVLAAVGDVPDWFGLALYPYQRAGAIAAAAGHSLIADSPGLGKTRQGLAAAAILGSKRTIVVCPPVVLASWTEHAYESALCDQPTPDGLPAEVITIVAGRKQPDIPDWGVVIVSDSLIASRSELAADLREWAADVLIVDEVHRQKSWSSNRAKAIRALASTVRHPVGLSGTPMFASPHELPGVLAVTGHLDWVFGGWQRFMDTFCKRNQFEQWVPRRDKLPLLKEKLDEAVWVRRVKSEVETEMPPKVRRSQTVNVDLKEYRKAYREVEGKVDEWLDGLPGVPSRSEVKDWVMDQLGMVSSIRRAAGMAKLPAAVQWVQDWVEGYTEKDEMGVPHCARPLVVWGHHRDVTDALAAAVSDEVGGSESITGSTSQSERERIVKKFQAGDVPVLVCSIHAAGVGITLTASSDALFAETDWTPALVSQAEDRQHRIGQDRQVTATTLIAPGTLDAHIQKVLRHKGEILEQVMSGGDNDVVSADDSVIEDAPGPFQILDNIVAERMKKRGWA